MISNVTLLIGEDAFLIQTELDAIRKKFLDPASADFNYQKFSVNNDPAETILEACASLPMMAAYRLVLVTEAHELGGKDVGAWLNYFEKPSPSTQLVLIAPKIDRRLKIWQTALKLSVKFVELKVPYADRLPQWIFSQAASQGIELDREAASFLAETVGSNLMRQKQTLGQLALYVSPRKNVTVSDVERLVGGVGSQTVFDFADRVGERKWGEAEALLEKMLISGEPPVRLLFMLARHFRLLLLAHEGMAQKYSNPQLASLLGVNPYFVENYLRQARKLSLPALQNIYKNLLNADRDAKRSPLPPRLILEGFLLQTCRG